MSQGLETVDDAFGKPHMQKSTVALMLSEALGLVTLLTEVEIRKRTQESALIVQVFIYGSAIS
jgi:hypothetical protein